MSVETQGGLKVIESTAKREQEMTQLLTGVLKKRGLELPSDQSIVGLALKFLVARGQMRTKLNPPLMKEVCVETLTLEELYPEKYREFEQIRNAILEETAIATKVDPFRARVVHSELSLSEVSGLESADALVSSRYRD